MSLVSKIYPRGIQFKNRSNVSNVEPTSGAFCELSCRDKNSPNVEACLTISQSADDQKQPKC